MCTRLWRLSALALTIALARSPRAAAADVASVTGIVVDTASGERLARVRVRLDDDERETTTNDLGEFAFDNVAAGNHTLMVETVGYRRHRETCGVR